MYIKSNFTVHSVLYIKICLRRYMQNSIFIFIKKCFQKIKTILKKEKILYHVEAIFLLFVPILITLDQYIGIVGTILTGIPFIIGILSVILYQKRKIPKYIIMLILLIINSFFASNYEQQFEFVKPLIIMITCFDMAQDIEFLKIIKNYIEKYHKFITVSISVIIIFNIAVMFFSNSNYSNTWKMEAFEGMYGDPHQAAYRLCSLITYIIFLIKAKKNNNLVNLILLIICEFLILKTGARTPTVLGIALGMIAIYFMKDCILKIYKKYKKTSIAITILVVIAIIIYLPQTAFIQKSIISSKGTFDNGRAILRDADWNYFISSNIQNKIFGNDINVIRDVNFKVIYARIWCHNDIMQILLQFGIVMLIIYFETIIEAMIFNLKGQKKFDKFIIILLNLVYFFVAFYNGFFFHPRFIVTIPIIFMIYKLYNENVEINNVGGNGN